MKQLLILFWLCVGLVGFSQEFSPAFTSTASTNLLRISSFNYYSSNRFTNELMDKFIFGGYIDEALKTSTENRLKRFSSIGGEAEQKIEYWNNNIHPFRDENYGFLFSFSDNHFVSTNIASDLYRVAFYGNGPYLDQTLDFSYTGGVYQHYQKLGFGVYDNSTFSSLTLNYVSGSKTVEGRLGTTSMVSEIDSVLLNLYGGGFRSDKFYPYFGLQGNGISADLSYNYMFETKNARRHVFNLRLSNVGFMLWNKNSHNYSIDSSASYSGFDVQDFLNREDAGAKTYNFEDTLGISNSEGKVFTAMPIEFVLQKLPILDLTGFQVIGGIKTILTPNYFPYMFGGVYYSPVKNFAASTRISYGGFAGVRWGLDFAYFIQDKFNVSLSTFDLIGNLSSKIGHGRSLNFSLQFLF